MGRVLLAFLVVVLTVLAIDAGPASSQQAHRIGRLLVSDPCPTNGMFIDDDPLTEVLAKLGWDQGKNLFIECISAAGRPPSDLPLLSAELVARSPELIVTVSSGAIRAMMAATTTIPIVMSTPDPVGEGFVQSLSRPGGNVTGVADFSLELAAKRIEILREAMPDLKKVAVLYRRGGDATFFKRLEAQLNRAVEIYGIEWRVFYHDGHESDIEPLMREMKQQGYDLLYLIATPFTFPLRGMIAEIGLRYRLPILAEHPQYAIAGSLVSYGVDADEQQRHLAMQVDRVLRGAKPETLPVEQPTWMRLVINIKTAKALGIEIPPFLLTRADEVIE